MTQKRVSSCEFCDITYCDSQIGSTNPLLEQEFTITFETDEFVVFPDAAPLGPRHALLVPREHVLSFARLPQQRRQRAREVIDYLFEHFPSPDDHAPYLFEHGSREADESAGCGITHAHLHILFLPDGILDGQHDVTHFDIYADLPAAFEELGQDDYYLFGRYQHPVRATAVEEATELKCSMFLRKWVAGQLGRPELADYRRYQTQGCDDMFDEIARTQRLLAEATPP